LKNKKALTILFVANGISGFAQGITMLSIPWYFTKNDMSIVFIASYAVITLGSLFWGLYAGALIDGFNRKDVFLGTNFLSGLILLSVASLGYKEGVLPVSLILLVFTTTFYGYYIHYPNLYAFAQEISNPKDYTKVTSYIEIVGQSTSMASAALGGILLDGIDVIETFSFFGMHFSIPITIEKWELHKIFIMDGLAYFVSFALILFIKYTPARRAMEVDEGDLEDRLKLGYDYLKKNMLITVFGVCSYSIFIITLVEIFTLRPLYVYNHLQERADVLGLTELMYACGSLVSGIVIRQVMSKMPVPKSIIIFTLLTAAAFTLATFTQEVYIFYIFSFITGLTNAGARIFRVSYLFSLIPNELSGRINSIFNVINIIARMIFILVFLIPFFSVGSQITYAYLILGLFTLAAAIVLIILYKPILKLTQNAAAEAVSH